MPNRLGNVVLALACWTSITTCRLDNQGPEELDPAELVGVYPIHQVDGHDIPWYHDMGALNCQIAFLSGDLRVDVDKRFFLDLDYNFRCPDSGDGAARLVISGNSITSTDGVYRLRGLGPSFLNPQAGLETWFLEVAPDGDFVTVRIAGEHRTYFADPVLTMGPRATPETR